MARLVRRDGHGGEPGDVVERTDVFGPMDRTFEHLFEMWPVFPLRRPMRTARGWFTDGFIPVDEFHEEGTLVIRAELPGIDPVENVELTVSGGVLRISAERKEEVKVEKEGYLRQELRHGSFERALTLPDGASEFDITATYKDGILEIRIPTAGSEPARRIPVVVGEQ